MLTPRQIELVKATVPVLREHGVALTTHFYRRMLEGNPELKNIFNQVHQARGRQQKALAGAVLAYAENIENPAVLLPAVKFIASKHATVGIRAPSTIRLSAGIFSPRSGRCWARPRPTSWSTPGLPPTDSLPT